MNPQRKMAIFLLPNAITLLSLLCGFLSMRVTVDTAYGEYRFVIAAYLILFAALCDGLDGGVARLTKTQSNFGMHLDSLCDAVSFGCAPAWLMFFFRLHPLGNTGFALSLIYLTSGILRLARFNVQTSLGKSSKNFMGLPLPMAACAICILCLSFYKIDTLLGDLQNSSAFWPVLKLIQIDNQKWILGAITLFLALAMISTFEYFSSKSLRLPRKRPFRFFALLACLSILVFAIEYHIALLIFIFIYCIHGPILWIFSHRPIAVDEEDLFAVDEDIFHGEDHE